MYWKLFSVQLLETGLETGAFKLQKGCTHHTSIINFILEPDR